MYVRSKSHVDTRPGDKDKTTTNNKDSGISQINSSDSQHSESYSPLSNIIIATNKTASDSTKQGKKQDEKTTSRSLNSQKLDRDSSNDAGSEGSVEEGEDGEQVEDVDCHGDVDHSISLGRSSKWLVVRNKRKYFNKKMRKKQRNKPNSTKSFLRNVNGQELDEETVRLQIKTGAPLSMNELDAAATTAAAALKEIRLHNPSETREETNNNSDHLSSSNFSEIGGEKIENKPAAFLHSSQPGDNNVSTSKENFYILLKEGGNDYYSPRLEGGNFPYGRQTENPLAAANLSTFHLLDFLDDDKLSGKMRRPEELSSDGSKSPTAKNKGHNLTATTTSPNKKSLISKKRQQGENVAQFSQNSKLYQNNKSHNRKTFPREERESIDNNFQSHGKKIVMRTETKSEKGRNRSTNLSLSPSKKEKRKTKETLLGTEKAMENHDGLTTIKARKDDDDIRIMRTKADENGKIHPPPIQLQQTKSDLEEELLSAFSQTKEAKNKKNLRPAKDFPSFAKSYILPHVISNEFVTRAKRKNQQRKLNPQPLTNNPMDHVNSYKTKKDLLFKYSMLKASLDYEAQKLSNVPKQQGRLSHNNPPIFQIKRWSKKSSPSISVSTPSTTASSARQVKYKNATKHNSKFGFTVPCTGPGSLKSYIDYVKEENVVPLPVLEPERGIEHELFAANSRQKEPNSESSQTESSSRLTQSFEEGLKSIAQAHQDIMDKFDVIKAKAEAAVEESKSARKHYGRKSSHTFAKRLSTQFEEMENLDFEDFDTKFHKGKKIPSTAKKQALEQKSGKGGTREMEESKYGTNNVSSPSSWTTGNERDKIIDLDTNIGDYGYDEAFVNKRDPGELDFPLGESVESRNEAWASDLFLHDDSLGADESLDGCQSSKWDHKYNNFYDEDEFNAYNDVDRLQLSDAFSKFTGDSKKSKVGSELGGENTLQFFYDLHDVSGSEKKHPALKEVMKKLDSTRVERAEKLRFQEDLFRLRSMRREGELRREHLVNKAKLLQARANQYKAKTREVLKQLACLHQLAVMWEEKLNEEKAKTGPLEEVCAILREDLDAAHRQRIEAFEVKMKPIIIRDGPSRKANYKISAARLHYDIYALTQRLRHTTMRAEHEEQRREFMERAVRRMREEISEKKVAITTVTKGIPFNKIEVRPEDQLPPHSYNPQAPSSPHKSSITLPPFSRTQYFTSSPSIAAGTLSTSFKPHHYSSAAPEFPTLPSDQNGIHTKLQTTSNGSEKTQTKTAAKLAPNGRLQSLQL